MKKVILVLFTFCVFLNSYSQITTNEQPISLSLFSGEELHSLKESLLDGHQAYTLSLVKTGKIVKY